MLVVAVLTFAAVAIAVTQWRRWFPHSRYMPNSEVEPDDSMAKDRDDLA